MDATAPITASSTERADVPTRFGGISGPQTAMPSINPPRVVHDTGGIDLPGAERAAAQFLEALGIQTDTESLHGTPGRMARAYAELSARAPWT